MARPAGVEKTVVEGVEFVEDEEFDGDQLDGESGDGQGGFLLAQVRPTRANRGRWGVCRRSCAR
jgi:hypothetical protein